MYLHVPMCKHQVYLTFAYDQAQLLREPIALQAEAAKRKQHTATAVLLNGKGTAGAALPDVLPGKATIDGYL